MAKEQSEKVNKGGRKGKFEQWLTPDGLLLVRGWARDGLTEAQIAIKMKIAMSTLSEWKIRFSELSEALKEEKEVADTKVVNSLYQRAVGYSYDEVTQERIYDKETDSFKLVVTKVVRKDIVPDTTAQIFWLKNRRPDKWRDKQEIEATGDITVNFSTKVIGSNGNNT